MHIAMVGGTQSEMDISILLEVIRKFGFNYTFLDWIDLSQGRDFLKEDFKYDIVILIYIFVSRFEELSDDDKKMSLLCPELVIGTQVSELHYSENWKKRLLGTMAQEILIFGYDNKSEVTGDYISELEGYVREDIMQKHGNIWRYKRNL